ncbi:type I phosphomannose isomerase catalytic subunit [Bacteroidota bacterium]
MNQLYPLKFKSIFKDKIWGGQKIHSVLGMNFAPLPNCGEVWVVSGVQGDPSVVANGFLEGNELNELIEIYMDDLVGGNVYERFGNEFPVLIKFIDSNDWLSIQVHPDDELAAIRDIGKGKTEMWYIMQADKKAELISGFNQYVDRDAYLEFLENKKIKEILNFEKVNKGDVFFMPAGRIHALGPGILLTEIQQTSDTTYRIYDWDRVDSEGKSRDLHTELALDAIDFNVYDDYRTKVNTKVNATIELINCDYFTTNLLELTKPIKKDYSELDSFVIYICHNGSAKLKYINGNISMKTGDAVLVPALLDDISIFPLSEASFLEVYIT